MEEKNRIIFEYINKKVVEAYNIGMFIPKDNIIKIYNAFSNWNVDVDVIKLKIDTIFNNGIAQYNANLERMGFEYDKIIEVYNKVMGMNKTKSKLYLTGGIVPYILLDEKSDRKHSNLNLLCNKEDAKVFREIFRKNKLYEPKRDSLTYTTNDSDYGFEVVVDGVKVNVALFEEKENSIFEYSFDSHRKVGRTIEIPVKYSEYIKPYYSSDNKKYMTRALEYIAADKLLLNREKDKKDIAKIQECNGISSEKIKKLPIPKIKEERLTGDNLEFTSTMPRIKLDIPKKKRSSGFINFGTILLIIAIIACIILSM